MADDKTTRVDRRKPQPPSAVRPPAADTIVFHCANGHRIVVAASLAGKKGKCTKCNAMVQIPPLGGPAGEVAPAAVPPPPPPMPSGETAPPFAFGGAPAAEAVAPVAAGGDAGAAVAEHAGGAAAPVDMFAGIVDSSDVHVHGSAEELVEASPAQGESMAGLYEQPPAGLDTNPTAALVARLWEERQHGGIIALHITGGSVILPEWYESRWSGGTHGLFASRAADDTVTLTAVAWDSIQKIVVRQVDGLPDGMFE
jgi:hypothetical protein